MAKIPFPQPDDHNGKINTESIGRRLTEKPWQTASANEVPLIFFAVEYKDGKATDYTYSDLREMRLIDGGHLELCVYGYEKYLITIEGARLQELREQLRSGRIKTIREANGPFMRPEGEPVIDKIIVEELTGLG